MATWTTAEWATASLVRLTIIGAGQTASAEDQLLAVSKANSLFPQLRRRGLAPFDADVIPEAAQDALEAMLADKLASSFGVTGERRAMLILEAKQAKIDLAAWIASEKPRLPIEVDDF